MITKHPPLDHEPADRGFIERGLRELVANTPIAVLRSSVHGWPHPVVTEHRDETDPQRRPLGV
jgi:hypothetical protein